MTTRKNWLMGVALLVLPALLALGLVSNWHGPQAAVYGAVRDVNRWRTDSSLRGFSTLDGEHFTVRYTQVDENVAPVVLDVAEDLYPRLINKLNFTPHERVQLVIYPDRQTLRDAFGWSGQESAMGVYWAGVIRLLSPNVWAGTQDPEELRQAFYRTGPLSHEFTHYMLDYRTSGNYPHWFSEGLAQWVEYNITGYLWIEPDSRLDQRRYSVEQLDRQFDELPNVALAYRESYLLVEYLAQQDGEESIGRLVDRLADGERFERAVQSEYGIAWQDLNGQFQAWLDENRRGLESPPLR